MSIQAQNTIKNILKYWYANHKMYCNFEKLYSLVWNMDIKMVTYKKKSLLEEWFGPQEFIHISMLVDSSRPIMRQEDVHVLLQLQENTILFFKMLTCVT